MCDHLELDSYKLKFIYYNLSFNIVLKSQAHPHWLCSKQAVNLVHVKFLKNFLFMKKIPKILIIMHKWKPILSQVCIFLAFLMNKNHLIVLL